MALDTPPPYDYAPKDGTSPGKPGPLPSQIKPPFQHNAPASQQAPPPAPAQGYAMHAGPSCYAPPQASTTYHYVNPVTGEHVVSALPPDHPQMRCLQEGHVRRTRFGLLGVLAAVFWFPLGIGLCLLDRRVTCERCGYILVDGVMCG